MIWHLKLGVSVSHSQCLMEGTTSHEPNGRVSVMNTVIVPMLNVTTACDNALYQS